MFKQPWTRKLKRKNYSFQIIFLLTLLCFFLHPISLKDPDIISSLHQLGMLCTLIYSLIRQRLADPCDTPEASQVALVVKNLLANAGDVRDTGLIPGLGRFPAGGHGNPLQCSCLVNPMDRRAWWATVHRVAKSWTQLSCTHGLALREWKVRNPSNPRAQHSACA